MVLMLLSGLLGGRAGVMASEFPDRECCDSAPPPPPHYHTTTSTTPVPQPQATSPPSTTVPPSYFPIPSVPPTGEGTLSVRNCLLARQLCTDDPSCRSVLEIIPRVCGPESVACSTVTVNKCLAALRTVQGFPYFQPTCLCREPHLDRECNVFREFIFDHPCIFVENKNEAPYTVHALPLCEYTLNVCEKLPGCIKLYEEFRNECRVRDEQCRMTDTTKCLSSWTKLKMSPMFGCICPMDRQKRKCERIFKRVHNNPCVDTFPVSSAQSSSGQRGGGAWGLVRPPRPTPRPHLPFPFPPPIYPPHHRPHNPWVATPPPHVTFLTDEPPPAFSAQTLNVLIVDRPATPRTPGRTVAPAIPTPLHSTCHSALKACMADERCRRLLTHVLDSCNQRCNRKECMTNLQIFYRNVDDKWANEVAFCLCKKSSTTANECLAAQEKLHPPCARQPAGNAPMLCNRLAAACKEDNEGGCRPRLEFYEQACAVDSNTRRCAGSTSECRRAVLLILGTQLRNLCTCVASDPRETFTCLDWQRILWFNPCVVESQMNYHRDMLATLNPGEEVTTTSNIILPSPTNVISKPVLNGVGGIFPDPGVNIDPDATPGSVIPPQYTDRHPYPRQPTPPPYTTTTTTTAIPTTTLPPKYCKKTLNSNDTIEEGGGRRYYNKGERCSSLCLCHDHEKQVACSVLDCIEPSPCETNYAVYTHAAPAYQASRGECFCYSGSFICVRPPKGSYNMNFGVYMFLGYSKKEVGLMVPYTPVNLVDVAKSKLSDMVREAALSNNGRDRRVSVQDPSHIKSECRLEEVLHEGENIIMQATLEEFADSRDNMSAAMLHKEKDACKAVVTELVHKINSHDKEVREDMALSVLILAELQVHIPPMPDSAVLASASPYLFLLTIFVSLHNVLLAS